MKEAEKKTAPSPETAAHTAAGEAAHLREAAETAAGFRSNRTFSPHASLDFSNIGDIPRDSWLEKRHWTDTPEGKAGIEFASRIMLGGMMYALVGQSKSMREVSSNYDPASFRQKKDKTWLEWVAFAVDKTLGAGLKKTAMALNGGNAEKADNFLRFRKERFKADGINRKQDGRSYGAEFTAVVADFGGMTEGTYIQRELMYGLLNPRERKAWLKDGHFDLGHALKRFGHKLWEGATYNLGEDIAATLPYVFFLRGCRNFIDKNVAPGFKIISDHVDNSGGLLVKGDGTVKSEYQLASMADLTLRFTGYNVITQMYRDGYNKLGTEFTRWQKDDFRITTPNLFKTPEKIPEKLVDNAKGLGRYMAISTIRSLLQMLVASPVFAIIRSPLSKPSGLVVNPKYGYMQMVLEDGSTTPVRRGGGRAGQPFAAYYEPNAIYSSGKLQGQPIRFQWSNAPDYNSWEGNQKRTIRKNPVGHFDNGDRIDVYGMSRGNDRALSYNSFSRLTDTIGGNLEKVADLSFWQKSQNWFWKLTGNADRAAHMSRESALAGMPYAAYFATKVLLREKYVNEQMNLAIGRMLDGILSFNKNEIREGMSEIQRTMMGLPFKEPNRQAELIENHRFHPTDKSPIPQNWSGEQHQEYLRQHQEGIAPNPLELSANISQIRANKYAEKARKMTRHSPHLSKVESITEQGEARSVGPSGEWGEDSPTREAQKSYEMML